MPTLHDHSNVVRRLTKYPDVLTAPQVAQILQCAESTVYALCKRPDFPAVWVGSRSVRVGREALFLWLRTPQAPPQREPPKPMVVVQRRRRSS